MRETDLVSLYSSVRAEQSPRLGGDATCFDSALDAGSAAPRARAQGLQGPAADPATFDFERGGEDGQFALTPAQQAEFTSDFHRDLERLQEWAADNRWPPLATPPLQISISHKYRISKSLVPAWYGRAGHMQFPAWRVAARKAAIAHELVHVFWPNGNRLLAEGLAIHLQAAIGGNPAFPNFGKPLHALACERMQAMMPACQPSHAEGFGHVHLSELDAIATPGPLVLKVGQDCYGEDARGQAHLYPIAGSFVQFLIEATGLEKFRALYLQTPLVPRALNGGTRERWTGIYGRSLADLERDWKSMIGKCAEAVGLLP
jgi:hypothetical protein